MVIHRQDTVLTFKIGGISLQINELFLPRESLEQLYQQARAEVRLFSGHQPWQFSLKTMSPPQKIEFRTRLELALGVTLAGLQQVKSSGRLALKDFTMIESQPNDSSRQRKVIVPDLASISYALVDNASEASLSIDHLLASLGKETIFNIQGNITNYFDQPVLDLEVKDSQVNLHNLIELVKPLLPDTVQSQLDLISVAGMASLAGTKIQGNPLADSLANALVFDIKFLIDGLSANYLDPAIRFENDLTGATFESRARGLFTINGIQKTDVTANLKLDSIYLAIDTTEFSFEDLQFNLITSLNAEFIPDSLIANIRLENFFDVPLDFNFRFASLDRWAHYQATGNLVVRDLPLSELPESTMEGSVYFSLNLSSESLDRIDLELSAASDIIEMKIEGEPEPWIFYPIDISSQAVLATDTTFQKIDLDWMSLEISNFATATIHGDFLTDVPQRLNLLIDQATVEHDELMEILPEQILVGFESLRVHGATDLTADISIILPLDDEPILNADGQVSLSASVIYPDVFLTIGAIDSKLKFEVGQDSGTFNLTGLIDSLVIEGVRDEPLTNMTVRADGYFPNFEKIVLNNARLIIPDLMTRVRLQAEIDSLSAENIALQGRGYLSFDSQQDTVTLLNELRLSGVLSQEIELSLLHNIAEITGNLDITNLNLVYEELARVDSISGTVFISQKFDIENETIIENPLSQSFVAGAGSYYYDLLRPYYQQDRNRFSHIRIARIEAMDYQATDLRFDIYIQNERIEIPRFSFKAYDGNMSGVVYANLHQGKADGIEWKVKANVSRLNSAKLIPTRRIKSKGSALNMNLELAGMGIDPASQLDIEGNFYVTQIGPQFTDNVLRSLDPTGTDKSIQDTRKLLNWGYKPKLLSFEIRHGYLYPTIHLVKGKFLTKLIPLKLSGGKIELARIPVKFFFQNMMTETK